MMQWHAFACCSMKNLPKNRIPSPGDGGCWCSWAKSVKNQEDRKKGMESRNPESPTQSGKKKVGRVEVGRRR